MQRNRLYSQVSTFATESMLDALPTRLHAVSPYKSQSLIEWEERKKEKKNSQIKHRPSPPLSSHLSSPSPRLRGLKEGRILNTASCVV